MMKLIYSILALLVWTALAALAQTVPPNPANVSHPKSETRTVIYVLENPEYQSRRYRVERIEVGPVPESVGNFPVNPAMVRRSEPLVVARQARPRPNTPIKKPAQIYAASAYLYNDRPSRGAATTRNQRVMEGYWPVDFAIIRPEPHVGDISSLKGGP